MHENAVGMKCGAAYARPGKAQVASKTDGVHLMDGRHSRFLEEALRDLRKQRR